jgi:transcriptional regulator with XRE-family HTH domain
MTRGMQDGGPGPRSEPRTAARVDKAVSLETIGPLLTRLRVGRGLSQLQVADRLCGLSGHPTVSRHEVSRWEREERLPGPMWRSWLAAVLDVPLEELEAAMTRTRPDISPAAIPGIKRAVERPQVWQVPTADQLLAVLDVGRADALSLAHAWLAGPVVVPDLENGIPDRRGVRTGAGDVQERAAKLETRLGVLRRQDDVAGGRGLVRVVDRELRWAIALLRQVDRGEVRRRALRVVAGYAQLAGWVRADAGQDAAAHRAYRVGLQAAAVAGDRDLAGYVLASLSHLGVGRDANEALLLAQSGVAGMRDGGSLLTRALLLHRVALAAARVGERRTAETALGEAERLAEEVEPEREPALLYWLDRDELAAMTGRCLAVLGRPLRAVRLLSRPRGEIGPRTAALYGVWLARSYVELGEVEEACRVAGRALVDAAASGSVRVADALRHLHPVLVRYGKVVTVREFERLVEEMAGRMPRPATAGRGGDGSGVWRRRGGDQRDGMQTKVKRPSGPSPAGRRNWGARPEPAQSGQAPGVVRVGGQQRTSGAAAAAATAGRSAGVAMGIRYTREPGT